MPTLSHPTAHLIPPFCAPRFLCRGQFWRRHGQVLQSAVVCNYGRKAHWCVRRLGTGRTFRMTALPRERAVLLYLH